ncbi:MAG: DUF4235 domain-containing protein [Candidatus Nanopelagicales bacterium]|nr:DUF4235 domain-containing protein [Candidatus Nanopelagicales bacterium]
MQNLPVRIIAPIISMGATFLARKGLTYVYKTRTGHEPPQAEDRDVSLIRVIGWAATTAVVSAVIEVTITRIASSCDSANQLEAAPGSSATG